MTSSEVRSFMNEKIFNIFFPTKFPNWKHAAVLLLAICLALTLSACGNSEAASKNSNTGEQSKIVSTKIVMAQVREVPRFIEATGTFQADESTDVAAETSGKVAQTLVNEGDFVTTGDVLIRLDERDANLRFQQSRASRESGAGAARASRSASEAIAGEFGIG